MSENTQKNLKNPTKTPFLSLFSWNLNGIRAVHRKGFLIPFLQSGGDIFCFQEIKAQPEQFFVSEIAPEYHAYWHSAERPGYSGTLTLSKKPTKNYIENFPVDFTDYLVKNFATSAASARLIASTISTPPTPTSTPCATPPDLSTLFTDSFGDTLSEGRLQTLEFDDFFLVNVYTPNSKAELERLSFRHQIWDKIFLMYLKFLEQTKPVVVCGDFNAAHQDIDLARPKNNHHHAGFTAEERQGITNLVKSGLLDTFRFLYPDVQKFTWWSNIGQARSRNVGWRIDYFFISESLQKNLIAAEIHDDVFGSDHCPISIKLKF